MMKILVVALLFVVCAFSQDLLVTKEYTDYLMKHVDWKVAEYDDNIFRGFTIEEARMFLGNKPPKNDAFIPQYEPTKEELESLPSSFDLRNVRGDCVHEVRNQGNCGSCWSFATSGMLADRCCLMSQDHGLLAPQELVSCDRKSEGCNGGWAVFALAYVNSMKGLSHDACVPYKAREIPCPTKCEDGKPWAESHVCNCLSPKKCIGTAAIKACLVSGPVAVSFDVCRSFFSYRSGIYTCDCTDSVGVHDVNAIGYGDDPKCHYIIRNSWGKVWGEKGYFQMACDTCGVEGKYENGNMICEKVE